MSDLKQHENLKIIDAATGAALGTRAVGKQSLPQPEALKQLGE